MSVRSTLVTLLCLFLPAALPARAAGFNDPVRYVFVTARDQARVAVIDSRDDRVVGQLDMGLVPSQLEMVGDPGRLVAIDGAGTRVAMVAVEDGAAAMVELDFAPTRLVAVAGKVFAAAPSAGRLAVIEAATGRVLGQGQVAPFRDLQPSGDGTRLVVAPERSEGVEVVDAASLAVVARVALPHPNPDGFATLARSPSGRQVYARAANAPVLAVVDIAEARMTGETAVGAGMPRAYANAVGITLVLPDSAARSVTLVPSSLRGGTTVAGEAGMNGVYSGWFDTVSFIPSAVSKSVVVVDQQGRFRGDDIVLGATPGRGTVTPDGRKLYLPLVDANRVAVIDAEQRKLVRYVSLPMAPSVALMGRTFGLCH